MDCEFGEVELLEPINVQDVIGSSMSGQHTSMSIDLRSSPTNELCLVYLPNRMILTGVLQLFSANLDLISNIKILRHATATSSFFAVLTMKDEYAYQIIYKEYNGRIMSSSDDSCFIFLPMKGTSVNVSITDSSDAVITVSKRTSRVFACRIFLIMYQMITESVAHRGRSQ